MDVSIIIVNWNTSQVTRDCLVSVYDQTHGIEFEVIVIDNASSDDSVAMIKHDFPQVVLIENTENKGFAAANNQGIEIAQGRHLLLLNSDTIILDGAIQKTVQFSDKHPDIGVLGCRVLNPDKTLQPTCFMYPSILNMILSTSYLYKLFPKNPFFGREKMTWWNRDDVREVEVVTGCFMLVRHDAVKQVGCMDERFFMYGEETDWCYRFKKGQWKVMFSPVGEIIHLGGQSSKRVKGEMVIQLRIAILQFIRKHNNILVNFLASLLIILFFALRIPILALLSIVQGHRKQTWLRIKAYGAGIFRVLSFKN